MKEGTERLLLVSASQNKRYTGRYCFLYMAGKLHPGDFSNIVARTRFKQWQHQLTCQREQEIYHKAPFLKEELMAIYGLGEKVTQCSSWMKVMIG